MTTATTIGQSGSRVSTHTTGAIASMLGAELVGRDDLEIDNLNTLAAANATTLSFIRSDRFVDKWEGSKAAAAVVTRSLRVKGHDPERRALLLVDDADMAMIRLLEFFDRPRHRPAPGVHPTAVVDPTARVPASVTIGARVVVGPRCELGEGVVLHAGVVLGADVKIGMGTELQPNVVVYDRCTIGMGCLLQAGVSIGADGFGYRPAPDGKGLLKIPHIGTVQIGDGVEIGANTCIDRGKFGATTIGDGTKIDNLVQIGHNCQIGRSVIICGLCGLAGSVTVGDGAVLAGQVGVADQLTIGLRATVTAKAGVISDVPPNSVWAGYPAQSHKDFMRMQASMRRLSEHFRMLKQLTKQLEGKDGGRRSGDTDRGAGEPDH